MPRPIESIDPNDHRRKIIRNTITREFYLQLREQPNWIATCKRYVHNDPNGLPGERNRVTNRLLSISNPDPSSGSFIMGDARNELSSELFELGMLCWEIGANLISNGNEQDRGEAVDWLNEALAAYLAASSEAVIEDHLLRESTQFLQALVLLQFDDIYTDREGAKILQELSRSGSPPVKVDAEQTLQTFNLHGLNERTSHIVE